MADFSRKSRRLMSRGQFQTLVAAIALVALVLVDTLFTNAGLSEHNSIAVAADVSSSGRLFENIEPTEITFRENEEITHPAVCKIGERGVASISSSRGPEEPCLLPSVE